MIELELWRARIGLNHAGAAGRVSRLMKKRFKGLNKSYLMEWGADTGEIINGVAYALRSFVALVLLLRCILMLFKRKKIVGEVAGFVQAFSGDIKSVLTSGVPLLLKVCVVMIPLLLLLAGDVERNPGPVEVVAPDHISKLTELLIDVAPRWELFLGQLGLSQVDIDNIKDENHGRCSFNNLCLKTGLQHWVVSDLNPMYANIVDTLCGRTVTDRPLALKVESFAASQHEQMSLGCGCGRCHPYKGHLCESREPISFPTEAEPEDLVCRTQEQRKGTVMTMMAKFNTLVTQFQTSLDQRRITPKQIASCLIGLDAYPPKFSQTSSPLPLFWEQNDKVRNARTIEDALYILRHYISFFELYVLEELVKNHGTDRDKEQLKYYKEELNVYLQSRIVHLPSKRAPFNKESSSIFIKLEEHFKKYNGEYLDTFKIKFAETLGVNPGGVLILYDVTIGCFELIYQLPRFISDNIFPLTSYQEGQLASLGVQKLIHRRYRLLASEVRAKTTPKLLADSATSIAYEHGKDMKRQLHATIQKRSQTIEELEVIIKTIKTHHNRVRAAEGAGAVGATTIALAGIIAAPFTFGLSLLALPGAVGVAIAANAGAEGTRKHFSKKEFEKAQALLDVDRDLTSHFRDIAQTLMNECEELRSKHGAFSKETIMATVLKGQPKDFECDMIDIISLLKLIEDALKATDEYWVAVKEAIVIQLEIEGVSFLAIIFPISLYKSASKHSDSMIKIVQELQRNKVKLHHLEKVLAKG